MKPSIPKGTRDLSPLEMARRQYILDIIRSAFRRYGFQPLETPAMENSETLLGKYGEEGDRLVFRVLNSGNYFSSFKDDGELIGKKNESFARFTNSISEKALRYDLTVPFARYVVMHQNEITFPFKRYQIQPVWRADRPQKGRYREFYQCDADVIGSKSLLNEVELIGVMRDVFAELGLSVRLMMNNRKVLQGIAQLFHVEDRLIDFVSTLDKHDKIGTEGVLKEYCEKGYPSQVIDQMRTYMIEADEQVGGRTNVLYNRFEQDGIEIGKTGILELHWISRALKVIFDESKGWEQTFQLVHDLTLARGLDYYTGAIFEVKAAEGTLQSSISGGGRYDDLTGIFGLKGMSGVGISFGLDRIYDVLLETGKFPADLEQGPKLLFANFGEKEALHSLQLLRKVREAGFAAELYPDQVKMAKQFKYADERKIPFVAIIGENEMKMRIVTVKDMRSGEQKAVNESELISLLQ